MVVQHVSDLPFPTDSILGVVRGVYSHRAPLRRVNCSGPPVALCDSPGKEVRKCWDCFTELSWPHLPHRPLPYFWSPFQGMGAAANGPEVWESLPHLAGRQGTGEVGQSLWLAVPVGTLNMTFGKLVFPRQGRQGCLLRRIPIVQSLEDLESRKSWGPPSKLHKVV